MLNLHNQSAYTSTNKDKLQPQICQLTIQINQCKNLRTTNSNISNRMKTKAHLKAKKDKQYSRFVKNYPDYTNNTSGLFKFLETHKYNLDHIITKSKYLNKFYFNFLYISSFGRFKKTTSKTSFIYMILYKNIKILQKLSTIFVNTTQIFGKISFQFWNHFQIVSPCSQNPQKLNQIQKHQPLKYKILSCRQLRKKFQSKTQTPASMFQNS
eukprot:TRINITY_DN12359_c0_g2_i1.p1 TRINITY_DN12359_c0_g2~~TRINITY_DN12359_c0_g2_i1.p1  ORF type:complete len:211 (+),score=-7.52 TRINITY_DN12359_c0_g2_i1:78-710(+)